MNKIILTGRIASKPNGGITSSQIEYSRFTIASQRRQFGQNTERLVDFLPCVAFNKNAEFVNKFLEKGVLVLIEGTLQTSKFIKDNVTNTQYNILVESIESLETKKILEQRRKNQDTQTFNIIDDFENESKNKDESALNNQNSNVELDNDKNVVNDEDDWRTIFDDFYKN